MTTTRAPSLLIRGRLRLSPRLWDFTPRATFPLSRGTFFNADQASAKPLPPALTEFVRLILSRHGQAVVREQAIFLPIASEKIFREFLLAPRKRAPVFWPIGTRRPP